MKIKSTHVIGALLIIGIVVAAYYYMQTQKVPSGQLTKFEQYAQNLGLNVTQFSTCLSSQKYLSDVQNDFNDGRLYGVSGTPTFFINDQKLVGYMTFDGFKPTIDAQIANPTNSIQIRTGSNPVRGDSKASVTIVEFSDYQCSYCARSESTISQVLQQYQGKVKLYYRDFPLTNIHPFSEAAAEASRCAGEQGKFWEYHDMLFDKQTEWSAG